MSVWNSLSLKIQKHKIHLFYFIVLVVITALVYLMSLASFNKVEDLISYRFKINSIHEKWIILKSDALSYLKADKQENLKAKLIQSLELFERDFMFFSKTEFNQLKKESPEIFTNSLLLLLSWQDVSKKLMEMIETSSELVYFTPQIYWLVNDTISFEEYLVEIIRWFDSYNRKQLIFYWRTSYFFTVLIILSTLLAIKLSREYLRAKKTSEKTFNLMHSIVSERENERLKLALEIHDTIIQDLSLSRILCYDLNNSRFKNETHQKLDELTKLLMKTTGQIREMTYDLMPPEVENKNIETIFSEYCLNFREATGINTELVVTGFKNYTMKKSQQVTLYRILQECLTNVRKHSGAKNVSVKLLLSYPSVIFRISDDGKGVDQTVPESKPVHHLHIGLKGIQERVNMFDGEMNIKNIPGKGFTLGIKMLLLESVNER